MSVKRLDPVVLALVLIFGLATHAPARAQLAVSPDVSFDLGAGFVVHDEEALLDTGGVLYLDPSLPAIPANVGLSALHYDGADVLFAVDSASLIEGVTVEARDVGRWDGSVVTIAVDGSEVGIPDGTRIDAIVLVGFPVLSLDTSARIGMLDVDDEDLFRLLPAPSMIFDGSLEGIDPSLDLNGATLFASDPTNGYLSFDGSGSVGGVDFDDEDILAWNLSTGAFSLFYDGSQQLPGSESADFEAVPEPGRVFGLWVGVVGLVGAASLHRQRLHRARRRN